MRRLFFVIMILTLLAVSAMGEVIDRVVAFIDNTAITQSELEQTYQKTLSQIPDITRKEVLQTMINRFLILREARQLRLEAPTDDELVNDYIEIKVKAFIRITDEQEEQYYKNNIGRFKGAKFEDVKPQIEKLLFEKELNKRLEQHIKSIREKAYIKVLLN